MAGEEAVQVDIPSGSAAGRQVGSPGFLQPADGVVVVPGLPGIHDPLGLLLALPDHPVGMAFDGGVHDALQGVVGDVGDAVYGLDRPVHQPFVQVDLNGRFGIGKPLHVLQEPGLDLGPAWAGQLLHTPVGGQVGALPEGDDGGFQGHLLATYALGCLAQPAGEGFLHPFQGEAVLGDAKGLFDRPVLPQGLGQGQRFLGGGGVAQPVSHGLLHAPQPHQHPQVVLGLPLGLGQVEILLVAPLAFQDVEPGDGQCIGVPGGFIFPDSLLGDLALEHPQQRGVVPSLSGGLAGDLEDIIQAVFVQFVLPLGQLLLPGSAFLGREVGAEDRLGPGRGQVVEEAAHVAVGVVEVDPAGDVLIGDGLEDGQGVAPISGLDEVPGPVEQLTYFIHHPGDLPVGLGGGHPVQAVQEVADLTPEGGGVHGCPPLARGPLGRLGGLGRSGLHQGDLVLDAVGQVGGPLGQLQEQGQELIPTQVAQQCFHRGAFLDLVRLVEAGEQDGDDVLAPAAPVVRAGAVGIGEAVFVEGDLHPVGEVLASLYFGLDTVAPSGDGDDGSAPVIVLAAMEGLVAGVLPDGGFAQVGDGHWGSPRRSK